MIEFQVNEIFDSIYDHESDKALALYLLLNQDFIDTGAKVKKTIVNFNIQNFKQQDNVSDELKILIPDSDELEDYETKE